MNIIQKYIGELRKSWKMIMIITLSFVIIANVYSTFFMKTKYEAKVKLFIGKEKFMNVNTEYNNEEVTMYQNLIKTYSEIIKTKELLTKSIIDSEVNLLREEASNERIDYGVVYNNLSVTPLSDTQVLELKYTGSDSQEVYDLLYSITENTIAYSKELYPKVNIKVFEQVSVSYDNLFKKKIMVSALSLILGLALGMGLIFMLMITDNTFRSKDELEDEIGIGVIGIIPEF